MESEAETKREDNFLGVSAYLEDRGFSPTLARRLGGRELRYWTTDEIAQLFSKLDATPDDIRNPRLKSFEIRLSDEEAAAGLGPTDFVKPSWEQMVKSASTLGRLCVNSKGQFRMNPSGGYAALSHVWAQGIGADTRHCGLHKSLIEQIFDKMAPLKIRWLWIDSLAIPGSGQHLTDAEEQVKSGLINNMAEIYRMADQVVILDALVLRLESDEAHEIAALMCCGKWMTRIWTYQEVKFAKNPVIATKSGFLSLGDMSKKLARQTLAEGKRGSPAYNQSQIRPLGRVLDSLLNINGKTQIRLGDVAFACFGREATVKLDYARALFPLLGLEWEVGLNLEAAMRRIYESRKKEATRLILYYGPPRAAYPGWAPATFPGVRGFASMGPGEWKTRGIERGWFTSKVLSMESRKEDDQTYRFYVTLDRGNEGSDDLSRGAPCWMYVSSATVTESPESLSCFQHAVEEGTAYILRDRPLVYGSSQQVRRYAIAVVRFGKSPDNEAWVCFTAKVVPTPQDVTDIRDERLKWLLLHENPTVDGGRETSELKFGQSADNDCHNPTDI